jgi:GNAT superfamily N-acetyltransferase
MNEKDGNSQQCSLRRGMEIVPGRLADWKKLAQFHYRSHRLGAVDQVFVIRPRCEETQVVRRLLAGADIPVGVIVYGMPVPCVALRNRATDDRYVGLGGRTAMLQLINKELRCISRVVIHPQYRGIGLAHWFVRETLELAGTPLVEALAVMGRVNPFFEKAGMTRYQARPSKLTVRMLAAFEQVGLDPEQLYDTHHVCAMIRQGGAPAEQFVTDELRKFLERTSAETATELETLVETAVKGLLSRPVYYLWRRKDW